jgi:hypothetical protein
MSDIFDDLDTLKVEPARRQITAIVRPARVLQKEPFGMIFSQAKRIGGFTCVLVHLSYQMTMSGGKPVRATAAGTGCKKSRTRERALHFLEARGIAEIEWQGNGQAPLVKRLFNS